MPRAAKVDDDFRRVLDAVAVSRGFAVTSRDVAALGRAVAELSAIYNDTTAAAVRASSDASLAARLLFSFPRDVPKGEAAVSELVALDALPADDGSLSVLDLGAGLGAMTWGLARALHAAGREMTIRADLVDRDTAALTLAQRIFAERRDVGHVRIEARCTQGGASLGAARGRYGLVLLGQVLSELDRERTDDERLERHVALLAGLVADALLPGGAVVVVEPALRERTRHLHRVRDELLARGAANVFAPCTHSASCPALADPTDWCHEDLEIDLPDWLVPVARAAGLRFQGLTFSYLVLRADGRSLAELAPLRVVSAPRITKGKSEMFTCGRSETNDPRPASPRTRLTRLDRDRTPENADWDALARGDLVVIEPPSALPETTPDPNGQRRLAKGARVKKIDVGRSGQ